jgi:hypothetical protein
MKEAAPDTRNGFLIPVEKALYPDSGFLFNM